MPPHLVLGRAGQAPPREHRAARRPQDGRAGRRRRPRRARRLCPRLRPRAPCPNTAGPLPACPPVPRPPSLLPVASRPTPPRSARQGATAHSRACLLAQKRAGASGRSRALTGAAGGARAAGRGDILQCDGVERQGRQGQGACQPAELARRRLAQLQCAWRRERALGRPGASALGARDQPGWRPLRVFSTRWDSTHGRDLRKG